MSKAKLFLLVILEMAMLYLSHGVTRVLASGACATPNPKVSVAPNPNPSLSVMPSPSAEVTPIQDDEDDDSSQRLQETETIRKSFNLTAAHKALEVDNVFGSIDVVGGQGDQVQLVVNKTIRAESKEKMEAAKKE